MVGKKLKSLPIKLWVSLSSLVFITLLVFLAYSQSSTSYLPRDELFEQLAYSGEPITLRPISQAACPQNLFFTKLECEICLNAKHDCPDCCLAGVGNTAIAQRHIQCTPAADPDKFNCEPLSLFDSSTCPAVAECPILSTTCTQPYCDPQGAKTTPLARDQCEKINCEGIIPQMNFCYRNGCPPADLKPDNSETDCWFEKKDDLWYCKTATHTPENKGCLPLSKVQSSLGYEPGYHSLDTNSYYELVNYGPAVSNSAGLCPKLIANKLGIKKNTDNCYAYEPNPGYLNYVKNCTEQADQWQSCDGRLKCCQESATCNDPEQFSCPGIANCDTCDLSDPQQDCACKLRINWPWCDGVTAANCLTAEESLLDCFLGASTGCRSCFKEITDAQGKPAVEYEFVARSGETAVISWQINVDIDFADFSLPSELVTYFYTLVRVVEKANPHSSFPPHESIVHQKSFIGDFTIYSATHVPTESLEQGKIYQVKLYYFMPDINGLPGVPPGTDFSAQIRNARLTVARIRQ